MTQAIKNKINFPDPVMGPIGFTAASFKAAISGIGAIIKKPKILIITIFISVLQAVLSYLKIFMPFSVAVTYASFFTFAQGGMYAGLIGAVGGIIGKGIYAWFINTLFFPSFKNKKNKNELKETKPRGGFALLMAGTGIALIAYNFLTGNASLENSVIGITAIAACARTLKKKDGFLVGFICSFTKGRMTGGRAKKVIKGMIFGFLLGVLSSLKFKGVLCYMAGAVILAAASILLMGRKRVVAGTAALFIILSTTLPAYSSVLEYSKEWQDPYDAYGIKEKTFQGYMDLSHAMEASPPAAMELTLIAVGRNNFEESAWLSKQQVLAIDGESADFYIDSIQFSDFEFTSVVNLQLEEDGWYADSITSYSANNSWTNNETEEGKYGEYKKCYVSVFHQGPYGSAYKQYLEHDNIHEKVYINIPIPFAYGDVMGMSKGDSATEIFARVDRVKRDYGEDSYTPAFGGSWQLKEVKSYVIERSRGSYHTGETKEFKNEFSGNDPTYDTITTVEGNTINFKIISDFPPQVKSVQSFTATFAGLPAQMKAFETVKVTADVEGYYHDEIKNESRTYDSVPLSVGFLPGLRPDTFRTTESDSNIMAYPLGAGLGEIWFESAGGAFEAAVPQGQEEGELLTVELILGITEAYDATSSRHLGTPVIAYIYEWSMERVLPSDVEDEEDIGEDDNAGWGTGWVEDDGWNEHANEEETMAIGAMSAIAAIAGAGAAAGGFGAGPGGGLGSYIRKNKDGDLVVRDPVTGEENLYVSSEKTGLYTNPLTGAAYTEDELTSHIASRAENAGVLSQDYRTAQEAIKQQRQENQKLSSAKNELNFEKRMNKLQKDLEKKGAIGDDYADELAKKLKILQSQKKVDGEFNKDDLKKFQRTFNKWTRGEIAGARGLPKAENDWDIYKQGLALSGEEIARGDSYKAIGLRVAVGLLTGGASTGAAFVAEAGLELAQAGYTIKDYVDKGGDDWAEASKLAITNTLVGEGIGRSVGLGIRGIGLAASKTGQVLSKNKTGKYIVDGISDALDKTSRVMNANVGDVPKVIKQISKEASESAAAAKKAASMAAKLKTDAAKKTAQSADDAAKKVAQSTDDAAKKASLPKNVKDTEAYKKASKQVDDGLNRSKAAAAEKIEKYKNNANKNPELAVRNKAHEEGGKIGIDKVEKLEDARKALSSNPDSSELKKEFENAVRDVQINKHAQKIMNEKRLTGNDTRQGFNDFKIKKDAVISLNTSERVALELGLDPKNVSNVQATNSMDTKGVGDISGVAGKDDFGTAKGVEPRKFTESDINFNSLEKKGGEKISIDLDQTYRMEIELKDGTVISKDIPADKIRRIQNEEVYKAWNEGQLPLKPDGSIDHDAVKKFADDMDYTVVDARSADAYGTVGDLQQALKNDGTVRKYSDPEVVSKTISYKSDEWLERGGKKTMEGNIIGAEADIAEGIRQSTKQFDSQLVYQVKAINAEAGKTKLVIPDKLSEGMEVLKQIGYGEGKISPAEAEAILSEMGTSTEDIMKLCAEEVEIINRFIAGGKR